MMDLRDELIEIIERECCARDSNGNIGDEVLGAESAVEEILSLPRIKEALDEMAQRERVRAELMEHASELAATGKLWNEAAQRLLGGNG